MKKCDAIDNYYHYELNKNSNNATYRYNTKSNMRTGSCLITISCARDRKAPMSLHNS